MDSKQLRLLGEAYASIQEGYGKEEEKEEKGEKEEKECVDKEDKGKHNCAKKVCHESFGEGTCIFGEHAEPDENGFVSHYDVMFEHGIEKDVPVSEMEVLEEGSHNEDYHRYEGGQIDEQRLSGTQRRAQQAQQQAAAAQSRQEFGQRFQSFVNRGGIAGAINRRLQSAVAQGGNLNRRGQGSTGGVRPAQSTITQAGLNLLRSQERPTAPSGAAPTTPSTPLADKVTPAAKPSTSVAGTFKPVPGAPTQASLATARPAPEKANILGNKASDLAASQAKAKADSLAQAAKNRARGQRPMSARERMLNQDLDLFDIVKGYLLDEGATEEEALKRMAVMTEEEKNEIIESSCGGGHSKKKKKKSGY
jgi:hypothetical protein